jgi:hypothetical protein
VVDNGKDSKKPGKKSVDKVEKHVKDDKGKNPEIPLKKEWQKKTYITNDQGNLRNKQLLIKEPFDTNKTIIVMLIGGHNNFGNGSRIIVTSRDIQVLMPMEYMRLGR